MKTITRDYPTFEAASRAKEDLAPLEIVGPMCVEREYEGSIWGKFRLIITITES